MYLSLIGALRFCIFESFPQPLTKYYPRMSTDYCKEEQGNQMDADLSIAIAVLDASIATEVYFFENFRYWILESSSVDSISLTWYGSSRMHTAVLVIERGRMYGHTSYAYVKRIIVHDPSPGGTEIASRIDVTYQENQLSKRWYCRKQYNAFLLLYYKWSILRQ